MGVCGTCLYFVLFAGFNFWGIGAALPKSKSAFFTSTRDCHGSWSELSDQRYTIFGAVALCLLMPLSCHGIDIDADRRTARHLQMDSDVVCPVQGQGGLNGKLAMHSEFVSITPELFLSHTGSRELVPISVDTPLVPMPQMDVRLISTEYKNGILGCNEKNRSCYFWRLGMAAWSDFAPTNRVHDGGDLVILKGMPFIIGGYDNGDLLVEVEFYDEVRDQWEFGTPMLQPKRSYMTLLVNDDTIILTGGVSQWFHTNIMVKYTLGDPSWTTLDTKYPVKISNGPALQIVLRDGREGGLFMGGFANNTWFPTACYFLSFDTMKFENATDFELPYPAVHGSARVHQGFIYWVPRAGIDFSSSIVLLKKDLNRLESPWEETELAISKWVYSRILSKLLVFKKPETGL